jgi:hypothetical protein
MPGREDRPFWTKESVPWPANPSLVVIVLSERATVRELWKWKNAVPTYVTVTVCPVHGFTSWNSTSIGNASADPRPRERRTQTPYPPRRDPPSWP